MNEIILNFICESENISLSDELKQHMSKRLYKQMKFSKARILVNGIPYELYQQVRRKDHITVKYVCSKEIKWPIYESRPNILYEDENYLVVNKRANLLSIPTKGEPYSLYQEILYYLQSTNQGASVSILNRLDRETRGLVVVAKNRLAASYLQPTHEKMIRKYKCLCHGILEIDEGRIENFIDRQGDCHKRFIAEASGKRAISYYRVLKRNTDTTLVEFTLETGRTHQIRLHTKCLEHPIVGDTMYGIDETPDLHLCSTYVRFVNPFTQKTVECEIESGWE